MDQLRDIRAMLCVAGTGSFTRAARQLNLSRSAVTKAVARLEEAYEIRLVNRNNHTLSLTAAGEKFVHDAGLIVAGLDLLADGLAEARDDLAGRIRLGVASVCAEEWFYRALVDFLDWYPEILIEVIADDGMLDVVREGVDVTIRAAARLSDTTLKARRLAGLPQVLVAAPKYLDRCGYPKVPGDLEHHVCLLSRGERQSSGWRLNGNVLVPVDGRIIAQTEASLHGLVLQGAGIAMLPLSVVQQDLEDGRLHHVLPGLEGETLSIYALSPERLFRPRRVQLLIDHFASRLRGRLPEHTLSVSPARAAV